MTSLEKYLQPTGNEKKKHAEEKDMPELVNYYEKEIRAKEEAMRKKKEILDKQ